MSTAFQARPSAVRVAVGGMTLVLVFFGLRSLFSGSQGTGSNSCDAPRIMHGGFKGDEWVHPGMTLGRKTLLSSKFLRLEEHEVRAENGKIINDWLWSDIHNQVNVLVQDENGHFLVFRQTKYGLVDQSLAAMGGMIEPGEDPLQAAQRELLEEMGRTTDRWVFLGSYRTDVNRGLGWCSCFLALGARPVAKSQRKASDDLEQQDLVRLSEAELLAEVLAGHFQEAKWSLTMAMGLLRMHNDRIQGADAVGLQAVQHDKARVFAHNDLVVPPWA